MGVSKRLLLLNVVVLIALTGTARLGAQMGPSTIHDCCKTTTEDTKFCCALCCLDSGSCPDGPNGKCQPRSEEPEG